MLVGADGQAGTWPGSQVGKRLRVSLAGMQMDGRAGGCGGWWARRWAGKLFDSNCGVGEMPDLVQSQPVVYSIAVHPLPGSPPSAIPSLTSSSNLCSSRARS